ncbi:MAG: R3H domain-containing nucleic acid-binding protein [Leptolyngbyaceae bacterium]|nr:R3H domain-containing nucleic acid-binding protein [Leptolyngbyaceae bacterium]
MNQVAAADKMDESQRGQLWLEKLLHLMGVSSSVKAESQAASEPDLTPAQAEAGESQSVASCWLTIDETLLQPEQIQLLTGSEGAVLDAMQYLANTILNLGQERSHQKAYTLELDGYRARRLAELMAMAEQAAEQVRQTGQEVELKSLSSAERRQVHTLLQADTELETYSRGREPDRRLVIRRVQS